MLEKITLNLPELRNRVLREPELHLSRITFLCGANGSGKSTFLDAMRDFVITGPASGRTWTQETAPVILAGDCWAICFFSTEEDNLRTQSVDHVFDPYMLSRRFDAKEMSHGQSNYRALQDVINGDRYDVVVLKEPEVALDVDGQLWLRRELFASRKQFVIETHSPLLLQLAKFEGVTAQTFGADPGYLARVLDVYASTISGQADPQPQPRLKLKRRSHAKPRRKASPAG